MATARRRSRRAGGGLASTRESWGNKAKVIAAATVGRVDDADEEASSRCKSPPPDLRVLRLRFEGPFSIGKFGGPSGRSPTSNATCPRCSRRTAHANLVHLRNSHRYLGHRRGY